MITKLFIINTSLPLNACCLYVSDLNGRNGLVAQQLKLCATAVKGSRSNVSNQSTTVESLSKTLNPSTAHLNRVSIARQFGQMNEKMESVNPLLHGLSTKQHSTKSPLKRTARQYYGNQVHQHLCLYLLMHLSVLNILYLILFHKPN